MLKFLFNAMSLKRRRQLTLLALLMIGSAVMEALTIGATVPFLTLLARPDGGTLPPALLIELGRFGEPLTATALLLTVAATVLAVLRLTLLWQQQYFAMQFGRDLSERVFARLIRQSYTAYLDQNTGDLLAGVEKSERVAQFVLLPTLQAAAALVLATFIVAALAIVNPSAALLAAVVSGSTYATVRLISRRSVEETSRMLAAAIGARNRTVREALGGIRDIILERSQGMHERRYAEHNSRGRRAFAVTEFIAQGPRHAVEAVGVWVVALLAYFMSQGSDGFAGAVPVVGAFALGAQRLFPLLQQAWLGYSLPSTYQHWLRDVRTLLELPIAEDSASRKPLPFHRSIAINNVSFAYAPGRPSLTDFSCEIAAGERVGIVGPSGSGKSTLADLLMGLLEPQSGHILVDGVPLDRARRRDWQSNIAHVPQTVYLIDDTIAANIALPADADEPNWPWLFEVARVAQLEPFVLSLPDQWATIIGEGGVRLSGGQRQRIGIARALYRRRPVLLLDEATNALDKEAEAAILKEIVALALAPTLIIIGHRSSAVATCNRLIRLQRRSVSGVKPEDRPT